MGFIVRPTEWEIQHAGGIFAGQAYQAQNGGQLPDTPIWRMLEFRYDLNAARFAYYHPNVARMIEQKLLSPPSSSVDPPSIVPPITPPEPILPPVTPPITPPLPIVPPITPPVTPPGDGGQIIAPPGPDAGGGGGVVPEPSSLTMLLVAVAVLATFCLHLTKKARKGTLPFKPRSN